ncbi:MAG: tRNA (adenosine(37)-N6)-threonylcarbamoyltransferase complex dimerization subunit type 1 TsaB [Candidatus Chaera renei]|uniref:tRNA (Adenosine(37)-N6)-threonylcarbamoyltransferase complex dimerization subunit type 1 TsaB n=1 Tax=Candidatus Chaera renei TaxID=2506947 RepID=A0A4Q0AJK0_9BACT|nr:MAG: tRNA (adenosine(37)-N6)-threonylcarbamoyltransferase complex dimerization subunit type 1 TsaB [Candidatus Chaera renei]
MTLAIKTDTAKAEVILLDRSGRQLSRRAWVAGRSLEADIFQAISRQLKKVKAGWRDIEGIVVFAGPGSFTGLRIGAAAANALAAGLGCPVAGSGGPDWLEDGLTALKSGRADPIVLPDYGRQPGISSPKK